MTSRERVLTTLSLQTPDQVPYMEFGIDRSLAGRLLGWEQSSDLRTNLERNHFSIAELQEVGDCIGLDNFPYVLRAPIYADKHAGKDGRLYYGDGKIKGHADLKTIDLPDPASDELYAEAASFAAAKKDRAACFVTRAGMFPALLSAGIETFSVSLYDNRQFIEDLLDIYFEWSYKVAEKVSTMDFDFYVTTDDMAFKSAPYFSPDVFKEFMLPRYRELARQVALPWVMHSDGNLSPYAEMLLSIGIAGLHPLEKGAMDIADFKKQYGQRVCLLGNLDLNILAEGTEDDTRAEVRWLLANVAGDGGYILTSGNSLASYVKPENVLAMTDELGKYGSYPINLQQ